jgi:hypothetical protein
VTGRAVIGPAAGGTAPLRVANASGFYGDRFTAMREMLTGGPIDVLTGDYLAELTMLILGRDRLRDPALGYARTFLRQLEDCLGLALDGGVRIVVNAGGLNPAGLATALAELATRLGLAPRIAHVEGDDLLPRAAELGLGTPLTANAYLGGFGIATCLDAGADVVVTGRVTDASLVVGAAAAHFGWRRDDWDALAGATVAGHLIECGAQVTGGNFAFFRELTDTRVPGFPVAEIDADGSATITKHPGTGGAVTVQTVTAQLLYEIAGPLYLGPDVATRLDTVTLTQDGPDRVRVHGVAGAPPPADLKVCLNALGGFRTAMTFVLTGLDIEAKAALVRAQLDDALGDAGPRELTWTLARVDAEDADTEQRASALLQVVAVDTDRTRAGRVFTQAVTGLALASYPGLHVTTPPVDAAAYGVYSVGWVPQDAVAHTAVLPDGTRRRIMPPRIGTPPVVGAQAAGAVPVGPIRRLPFGTLIGARSGDKGGDANLGVWARTDAAYAWLAATLTVERLRDLLPETRGLAVQRHDLPRVRALNFVLPGLLGAGVAASTRFDPQAKALGEWLRARHVDIPEALL